jgi:hypothetical protein
MRERIPSRGSRYFDLEVHMQLISDFCSILYSSQVVV